jgi:hypothetical protein
VFRGWNLLWKAKLMMGPPSLKTKIKDGTPTLSKFLDPPPRTTPYNYISQALEVRSPRKSLFHAPKINTLLKLNELLN